MNEFPTVRVLVIGDDNVGKTTLVHALCGASSHAIGKPVPGCSVSVRVGDDGKQVEEFYEVAGASCFQHGRQVFFSQRHYDGIIFVYDLSDASTRSSISCTWVPEVMRHLGDVGAIEAGGRLDGNDVHVRSAGVVNEVKFLWRQALFSHSGVSVAQAMQESLRLSWRFVRLFSNELGIWSDSSLDQEAETSFLATSLVPTAIVGMKSDLVDRADLLGSDAGRGGKASADIHIHANNAANDSRLAAFLSRVASCAKRKSPSQARHRHSTSGTDHMILGFS